MAQAPQQQQEGGSQSALVVFQGFEGLNTQPSRYGIGDRQCYIMDGFFPLGNNNARVIPDLLNRSPTNPYGSQITFFDFGTLSDGVTYMVIAYADGSLWTMDPNVLLQVQIAPPGTVADPHQQKMGVSSWGSQFILIATTSGYFLWDGITFYTAGMAVPGYSVLSAVSGTAIETYAGHVWIANGATINFSAPGSPSDFSGASGGGGFLSNDSTLRFVYTQLKAANGYLYLFGDSSISYIAGVQTAGTPPVTTFTLQNVDPEVGTIWPNTVDVMGSNIVFANAWGAFVSYGGRAARVSAPLDGVYPVAQPFFPSACKTIMFNRRVWAILLEINDQVSGDPVKELFIWDEKNWCSAKQSADLTYVQHQETNSILTAWGTDGTNLYKLFSQPSTVQTKTLQSKFWTPHPLVYAETEAEDRLWGLFQYFTGDASSLDISIDSEFGRSDVTMPIAPLNVVFHNNSGDAVSWVNISADPLSFVTANSGIQVLPPQATAQQGALVGFTLQTQASDIAIISLATASIPVGYRG